MTISISGSPSTPPATPSLSASFASAQPVQKTAEQDNTVKLSQAGRAHLLKRQGQSISQIATSLSISTATVDGYLGVVIPKAASVLPPVAPPAPAQSTAASAPPAPAKG